MPSISRMRITPCASTAIVWSSTRAAAGRAGADQPVGDGAGVLERREVGGAVRRAGERRRRERMADRDVADAGAVRDAVADKADSINVNAIAGKETEKSLFKRVCMLVS